ncbi:MAG: hypothetical protein RLZZ450_581 [Pseudomonadota bacterium]|jgi:hypothetical protein
MTKVGELLCRASVLAWLWGAPHASTAIAQDVAPETLLQSNALFAQGKRELEAGATVAACVSFSESYRLVPRGGTLLNLGLCHEQAGHLSEAWRTLRLALSTAAAEGRSDRIPLASEHIAAVESKLSWVSLSLPHDVDPSLVAVRLDGAPIAHGEWGAVPLEVGEHVLTAEALGFESWSQKVVISAPQLRLHVGVGPLTSRHGDTPTTTLTATPSPVPPAAAPPPGQPVPYATPYGPYSFPAYPQRTRRTLDPVLLAEQRAARETWFTELAIGVTGSADNDEFLKTLKAFGYQSTESRAGTIDGTLGVMFTRNLGLAAHYTRLGWDQYETPDQKETFSFSTQALLFGVRLRQPLLSHWLVVFAELDAGVSFTNSTLRYQVAMAGVPTGFVDRHDDERDRSLIIRGLVGLNIGFTRHFGVYLAAGYTHAPTLHNSIDEVHQSGGGTFLTGLRVHGVKGWW